MNHRLFALWTALLLVAVLASSVLAAPRRAEPFQGGPVLKLDIEGRGEVLIRLHKGDAPRTVAHIVRLVESGFYNGQRFHRAERSPRPYLVQIGDPASRNGVDPPVGNGGSGARIAYENSGKPNVEGAVGLASISGDKQSGDSQFYILLGASKFLDGHFTVFGQVVKGMDVVKAVQRGDRVRSATIIGG